MFESKLIEKLWANTLAMTLEHEKQRDMMAVIIKEPRAVKMFHELKNGDGAYVFLYITASEVKHTESNEEGFCSYCGAQQVKTNQYEDTQEEHIGVMC